MDNNTRKKLIDRGAEALADALISLAAQDDLAADVVERLSSNPQELITKVKRKIPGDDLYMASRREDGYFCTT